MLDTLKQLLSRWKVQVALVGGALVVATAYGTCVYSPAESDQPESVEVSVEPASNTVTETTGATDNTAAAATDNTAATATD